MTQSQSQINLPQIEEEIFEYWNQNDIFKHTLEQTQDRPIFNFYDGPPFATGNPHYGHLLAATIKDTVCRYQTLNGNFVPRINGFDCHGLPIEQLGEKTLGIKTVDEINKMGIDKFNQTCESLVLSCANTWENVIPRMGRWVDFKNGYKTMDFEFMNATWGVFKRVFDKGLVYRSLTPMPYSTGCGSCLSHFEAKSNYQDTQDPSVVLKFPIKEGLPIDTNMKLSFLVWTTTPYSLTGNIALCINRKIKYSIVQSKIVNLDGTLSNDGDEAYIIATDCIKSWELKCRVLVPIMNVDAESLIGIKYQPPFTYNDSMEQTNPKLFTVLEDSYVKVDAGTGIVHLAPGMGEDDFRVCLREGLINPHKPESIPCPIDDKGCLTQNITEFSGLYVKEADKHIVKYLRTYNRLWEAKTINHSYPFCYRTDTPLIQKSISAWFIDVHSINDKIMELNSKINWIPSNVGESRFAQWLSTPRDWSFGRNRFWGTPVPLWVNDDFSEVVCIGSTVELEELAGLAKGSITNIHREFIDDIKIPSKKNLGTFLHRINDVMDCWFESGAMPYGKFAVENKLKGDEIYSLLSGQDAELLAKFMKCFPADFIGEGLDQTRGWFYTLLVLSTILFEDTAYKNVIVNGLILSSDPTSNGKWIKMSKRYKNYPNPEEVINKYGADSLRLYFLDSPVTHSEPLKFQEDGIQQKARFVLQLYNCFQFLESEIKLFLHKKNDNNNDNDKFVLVESSQIYDQWILGKLKEVMDKATQYYNEFKLYQVVPLLIEFEELFSKWYINLSKLNMKGMNGIDIQSQSLSTLWKLLNNYVIMISPITPFISEKIYMGLQNLIKSDSDSPALKTIHLEQLEKHITALKYDPTIAKKVSSMVDVVMSVRGIKTTAGIGARMKSKELIIKHSDQSFLDNVKELETELMTTIKVDMITYQLLNLETQNDLMVNFNTQVIGKMVKRDMMAVVTTLRNMNPLEFVGKTSVICMGHEIPSSVWSFVPKMDSSDGFLVDYTISGLLIQLTKEIITTPLEDKMELMIKQIQKAKKDAKLKPYEIVTIYLTVNGNQNELLDLIKEECDNIKERLRSNLNLTDNTNIETNNKKISEFMNDYYSFTIYI
jgi:isoleucyl-tRNA synthetase